MALVTYKAIKTPDITNIFSQFSIDDEYEEPMMQFGIFNQNSFNSSYTPGNSMDDLLDDYNRNIPKTLQLNVSTPSESTETVPSSDLDQAINSSLGTKYNQARRMSPGYSDCSGFVNLVYLKLGKNLKGATSVGMWNNLTEHIDLSLVKPGDLVFLTPKATRSVGNMVRVAGIDPSHVAIVRKVDGTRIQVAESTPGRGASIWWYELDPNKKAGSGTYNYGKGNRSSVKNELLGFGRLKS